MPFIIISLVDKMEFIALLLIFYFFIGACVCLLICVNPNDQGILGKLNRVVFRKLPQAFSNIVRRIFGQGVLNCLGGIKHYIMQTNHPLVQIFYLLISPVGFALYQYYGILKHMPNNKIPGIHVAIANFLAFICFWVYYKACATSPGEISKQNVHSYVEKYKEYYDQQIYKTNNKCKTCNFNKPARSKHCSICKMCVAKHDHHCIWIRQCVGEKNYKYFISFLGLHSIWCLYLSVIGAISLIEYLNRINFYSMRFNIDGRAVPADNLLAFQYLFMSQTIFFFLIVMCAIMGFTLLLFVLYHLYLVSKGQTTNERVKKNDDIDYYHKELKASKKMLSRFTQGVTEIDFKGQKVSKQDLQTFQSLCHKKIAILTKVYCKKGFWGKLQDVFNL